MKLRILTVILSVCLFFCSCGSTSGYRLDGFAMNTMVSVTVYGKKSENNASAALREITATENNISWNVKSSETAKINAAGGNEVFAPTVAELIGELMPVCEATDGRYSLTLRELCELWGIGTEKANLPSEADISAALKNCDCEISLSGDKVTLSNPSAALDFGSVGKGFACDKVYDLLKSNGADAAVVSVGGSILCFGQKSGGFTIDIATPGNINKSLGQLKFTTTAFISTSGSEERFFETNGKKYHHIFDAKTGYPVVSELKSVTVVAKSGLISDSLSTACFILGKEKSTELLKSYGADAVFVTSKNEIYVTDGLSDKFTLINNDYVLK